MFSKKFALAFVSIVPACGYVHETRVEIAEGAAQRVCSAEYQEGYYDGVEQLWDDTSENCEASRLYGGEEDSCYDAGFLDGYESFDPCIAGQQGLIADDAAVE